MREKGKDRKVMEEKFDPATDREWRWRRRDEVSVYHQYRGFDTSQKSRCGRFGYPILGQSHPNPVAWDRCQACDQRRRGLIPDLAPRESGLRRGPQPKRGAEK
jgi:hypothetical protein